MQESESESDRVLDFGGFPGRWTITRSTEETDGRLLEMRFRIDSTTGDAPFLHVHPHAEESYRVLSGSLEVNVDGDWTDVPAGQTHTVPPNTPHTFRNHEPVEVVNIHRPALDIERFFVRFHRLVTDRGVRLPPRSFESMVLMGMLVSDHEEEVTSVRPPQFVMRALAFAGRVFGYELPG